MRLIQKYKSSIIGLVIMFIITTSFSTSSVKILDLTENDITNDIDNFNLDNIGTLSPYVEWSNIFNKYGGDDKAYTVMQTSDGGYFLCGTTFNPSNTDY